MGWGTVGFSFEVHQRPVSAPFSTCSIFTSPEISTKPTITGIDAIIIIAGLFTQVDALLGAPDVVVYNPSARVKGPLVDLVPADVENAIAVTAFGGFLVAQQAIRRMLPKGQGAMLFTGASASVKGYPQSAAFAMGKFALRGLAQSMARELAPQGIHVAHFVIDGAIRQQDGAHRDDGSDNMLDPDAIAQTYLQVLQQPRSAWTWEMELRPWAERF
jgi:NAD(P)-dependent dehydrogenase (short-subunit alcohol dehydrogenase family)